MVGLSLVELLIAMALSVTVVSIIAGAVSRMLAQAGWSADQAELAERSAFTVQRLAAAVTQSRALGVLNSTASMCLDPISFPVLYPGQGYGLRVIDPTPTLCTTVTDPVPDMPILVVDSVVPCAHKDCDNISRPFHLFLEPGCHPFLTKEAPEIRVHRDAERPADCGSEHPLQVWQRDLFYLRRYAWQPGDNLGALMVKSFRAETADFGRAEMLVPGVIGWHLAVLEQHALSLRLRVRGWHEPRGSVALVKGSGSSQAGTEALAASVQVLEVTLVGSR